VAGIASAGVRAASADTHEVIRIDAAWIAVEPLDMRAGVDTALARVVKVFGEARSHHAYMFLNRRANRLKVFVHDGFGLWLCARRLQQGHFVRPSTHRGERFELSMSQLQAFAVGLPWERLDEHAKISIL
jgi:transposase